MSFNPASSVGVSSASLHALSALSAPHSAGHPPVPHGPVSLLDRVALNPQPLPPKHDGAELGRGKVAAWDDGGWCGTVPRRLPPFPPPPPGPWADIASAATGMAR